MAKIIDPRVGVVSTDFFLASADDITGYSHAINDAYRKACGKELVRVTGATSRIIGSIVLSAMVDFGTGKEARSAAREVMPEELKDKGYAWDFWSCAARAFKAGDYDAIASRYSQLYKTHAAEKKIGKVAPAPVISSTSENIAPTQSARATLLNGIVALLEEASDETLVKVRMALVASNAPVHANPLLLAVAV